MQKQVLLLFSGGLDSTYLLYKNLKEGNKVYCIYMSIKNNRLKPEMEIESLQSIIKVFEEEFKTKIPLQINNITIASPGELLLFKQLPIHVLSIIMSLEYNFNEVQIGYCMNDDMISYLEDLKKLYISYQPFIEKDLPLITFPLFKISKQMMLHDLPESVRGLVFSCENPKEHLKPCGDCIPCITYNFLRIKYSLNYIYEQYTRLFPVYQITHSHSLSTYMKSKKLTDYEYNVDNDGEEEMSDKEEI